MDTALAVFGCLNVSVERVSADVVKIEFRVEAKRSAVVTLSPADAECLADLIKESARDEVSRVCDV